MKATLPVAREFEKKTEKAMNLDPSALIATFNIFVTGMAKKLLKLHQTELPPPPNNWREIKK